MSIARLIYASRATEALSDAELEQILTVSVRNNIRVGLTGLLLYSSREFLQCLEGEREPLNQTYARILADPRHSHVMILDYSEVGKRLFADWAMQRLNPLRLDRSTILRYSARELFAPTRMSAAGALGLLEELAQTGVAALVQGPRVA